MSDEMVKVIWDGARKFGVATGPGQAVYFQPGINEIPADVWKMLTKGKGSKDPGGVNHHLKGGLLRLALPEVQKMEPSQSIVDIGAEAAIEIVNECFDEDALGDLSDQERGRKGGGRKTVLAAIKTKAEAFEKLKTSKDEQDDESEE